MDLSEKDYKLEDTHKADSQEVDDLVLEKVNDENSVPMEEVPDQNSPQELDSEKLEEEKVDLDPISENHPSLDFTKPFVSLSEETKNPDENGVSADLFDYVSKGIESLSGENGVSPILNNAVSEGNAPALDEENEVPGVVIGSVSNGTKETEETIIPASDGNLIVANAPQSEDVPVVCADNGGEDTKSMPEIPQSTENQTYISVTPRPLQRTSWSSCCGLFEVLNRSDR